MDKLELLRTLIVALMIVLLVWDGLLWLTRQAPLLVHRELLMTVFLVWFITLFVNQTATTIGPDNFKGVSDGIFPYLRRAVFPLPFIQIFPLRMPPTANIYG